MIGILAAQSLGEPSTQLTLNTFQQTWGIIFAQTTPAQRRQVRRHSHYHKLLNIKMPARPLTRVRSVAVAQVGRCLRHVTSPDDAEYWDTFSDSIYIQEPLHSCQHDPAHHARALTPRRRRIPRRNVATKGKQRFPWPSECGPSLQASRPRAPARILSAWSTLDTSSCLTLTKQKCAHP